MVNKPCKACTEDAAQTVKLNQFTGPLYSPVTTCKEHVWYLKPTKEEANKGT